MSKGWQTKTVGDFCEVVAGQSPEGKFYNSDGKGLPFYQGKKDFGDRFIAAPTTWTTESTKLAKAGDILMSVRAPVGPVNFATSEVCIGRGLAAIRIRGGLDRDFLFYQLLYLQPEIAGKEGAVFASINKAGISELPLAIVALPEQQRIVALLDEAFEGLATAKVNAEKNLHNARAVFESELHSILSDEKWERKPLGELCSRVEYGSAAKSKGTGKVPVLRMGNVQNGSFDWTDLVYTNDEAEIKKYILKHNDVLFNRTNSPALVGKSAIYKSEMPAIFAGYLIRIVRNESVLDADYLNYYLNSEIALNHGKSVAISSVNQANINGAKLKDYLIPVPPLADQQAIAKRLGLISIEAHRLESIYRQKLTALGALKQSLLHQAFSGNL